jgi:sugar phosphate permease
MNKFDQHLSKKTLAWIVFGIAVLYYLYEYIQRVSPAVMVDELMRVFHINTMVLGNLSAIYLYIYAAFQIPVGILVDRFGPKRPLLYASLVCVIGSFIFSFSYHLPLAYVGRALVGLGSAFGYLCCLKLVVNWFSVKRFGFMCGLVNMVGMLGAAVGEYVLSRMMSTITWRSLLFSLSLLGLVVILMIWLFVKDQPSGQKKTQLSHRNKTSIPALLASFPRLLSSRQAWLSGIYVGAMYCTFNTLSNLWGVPYLQNVYHIDKVLATEINSLIFFGAVIGYLLFGWLTSMSNKYHKHLMIVAAVAAMADALILRYSSLSLSAVGCLFFMLGVLAGSTSTATTIAKESMPLSISGLTMSFVNTLLVLVGAFSQPLFGSLLSINGKPAVDLGVVSTGSFHRAFLLMPCLYCISFLCALLIRNIKKQASPVT